MTRPADSASALAEPLRDAGAEPVIVPLTLITAPADDAPLRAAAAHVDRYDWIVFTSANAVHALAPLAGASGTRRPRIAAVGSATAASVRRLIGRDPDLVPAEFSADALVATLLAQGSLRSARILWPRGDRARDTVPEALVGAGALLDDPIAYRTIEDPDAARRLASLVEHGGVDAITFTAPSSVECYAAARPDGDPVIAVIGPATLAEAGRRGLRVHVMPSRHTLAGLVAALEQYYAAHR
ncbi:MAG TPA: uroporphyrinogen-III synthase [Longimicrobiales bacterium]